MNPTYERTADRIEKVNLRLGFNHAIKRLDYVRRLELGKAIELVPFDRGTRVLDVASGRSPWPFYLALEAGCTVVSFDLSDSVYWQPRAWRRQGKRGALITMKHDACSLPYSDGAFSIVTAVSAIEHIDGTGDTQAVCEMARVLRPGGWLYITVPYDPRGGKDCFRNRTVYGREYAGKPLFWKRNYDDEMLGSRILEPAKRSGLDLQQTVYFGEPGFNYFNVVYTNPKIPRGLRAALFQITPIASRIFLRPVSREALLSVPYPQREGTANGVILLWSKS
jgi:SAM-dependent methyltransferase